MPEINRSTPSPVTAWDEAAANHEQSSSRRRGSTTNNIDKAGRAGGGIMSTTTNVTSTTTAVEQFSQHENGEVKKWPSVKVSEDTVRRCRLTSA